MSDFPFVVTDKDHSAAVEADIQNRRGVFIDAFLESQKEKLSAEKFNEHHGKLIKEGSDAFDRAEEGKYKFYELEKQAQRKTMNWKDLEKPLRQWLENESLGKGWSKEVIESTIETRKSDFERYQYIVNERLRKSDYSEEDAFQQRILNPATRKEAIRYFLQDRVDKKHYLVETVALLFQEIDKLKARRR